jgi:hypothetical protein
MRSRRRRSRPPEGSGEPQGGAPVDRPEGSGEPQGGAPVGRRVLVMLGLGLALGLGAAACGGSPDGNGVATLGGDGAGDRQQAGGGDGSARKDPQEAALEFARCMRGHGVDMPDPEVDSKGRIRVTIGSPAGKGGRPDPRKLNEAQQACGHLMGGGGEGPGKLDPKAQDAMLAFARCMREHGIDMPDPTGNGLLFNSKRGPDPSSSKFREAERACDHHLAGLRGVERSTEERP